MTELQHIFERHQLDQFHPQSKVWVYQANRPLESSEQASLAAKLQQFTRQWTAHNEALKATGFIALDRFIILMVDETQAAASGCSIDTSYRFLRELESTFGIELFDRLTLAYQTGSGVQTIHKDEIAAALERGDLTEETLVFNNLVQTREGLETNWLIPFKQSWAAQLVL